MAFKHYKNSPLLPWLVPIIPKGAKLSPKSGLTPERIGKIPGRWTDEGWVGYVEFTKTRATPKMLEGYDWFFEQSGHAPIVGMLNEEHILFDNDHDDATTNMIVDNAILRAARQGPAVPH